MNERIRAREVRVIGPNAENYGVIPFPEAMQRAREAGLDLVEVDSNGNPPVCRILDYGKWKYEQAKKEREGRKHQKGTMIHEVRMRPRTGQHDIDLKVRIAGRLLAEGDKVKLSVMFRGRELSHPEIGQEVLDKALKGIGDLATIEKPPGMEGRFLTVIMTPTAKKIEKPEKPERPMKAAATAKAVAAEPAGDGAVAVALAKAEAAVAEPVKTEPPAPKAEETPAAAPAEAATEPAKAEASAEAAPSANGTAEVVAAEPEAPAAVEGKEEKVD